jgi:hypothetical protein
MAIAVTPRVEKKEKRKKKMGLNAQPFKPHHSEKKAAFWPLFQSFGFKFL